MADGVKQHTDLSPRCTARRSPKTASAIGRNVFEQADHRRVRDVSAPGGRATSRYSGGAAEVIAVVVVVTVLSCQFLAGCSQHVVSE